MNARLKTVPPTLRQIEELTRAYADSRSTLAEHVAVLQELIAQARRKCIPIIKRSLAIAAERQAELRAAIEAAPAGTFEKPRTHIFHGIKVGFRKGAGKVTFEDADQVLKLIRRNFVPEKAELLIKVKESPNKEALAELDVAALKKLGCTIEGTGDVVEIRAVDSEVDKLVNALLKDATEAEGE